MGQLDVVIGQGGICLKGFELSKLRMDSAMALEQKEKKLTTILGDPDIGLARYRQLQQRAREALLNVYTVFRERLATEALLAEVSQRVLTISTVHMPEESPNWGEREVVSFGPGWVIFSYPVDASETPSWLRPIDRLAEEIHCELIRFACEGRIVPDLPVYEWEEKTEVAADEVIRPLRVQHGDPLSRVISHLHKCDKSVLIESLTDIIARSGFDENNLRDEHEPVSGSDFFDSVRHTLRSQLKLTF